MKNRNIFFKYGILISFYIFTVIYLMGCQIEKERYTIGRDPAWESLPLAPEVALTAFTNEVVDKVSNKGKMLVAIENCSPISLLSYLDEDRVQGILSNIYPELINLEKYTLSFPLLKTGPVLVVSALSSYSSLKDLKGKLIAAYQYDNSVSLIEEGEDYMIEMYEDPMIALSKIETGIYDGVLVPALEAYSLVSYFFKGKLKIITPPMSDVGIYLIVKQGSEEKLLKTMNSVCGVDGDSKILEKLRKKYQLMLQ